MVIEGAARGDVGTVVGLSKYSFDGEACWTVQLDERPYESTIRASFLVPEPAKSDEDVMGPLRRVRCP